MIVGAVKQSLQGLFTYDARASSPQGRQSGMEDPKPTGLDKLELEPHRKGLKSILVLVAADFGDEGIQKKWGFCHKLNTRN